MKLTPSLLTNSMYVYDNVYVYLSVKREIFRNIF